MVLVWSYLRTAAPARPPSPPPPGREAARWPSLLPHALLLLNQRRDQHWRQGRSACVLQPPMSPSCDVRMNDCCYRGRARLLRQGTAPGRRRLLQWQREERPTSGGQNENCAQYIFSVARRVELRLSSKNMKLYSKHIICRKREKRNVRLVCKSKI